MCVCVFHFRCAFYQEKETLALVDLSKSLHASSQALCAAAENLCDCADTVSGTVVCGSLFKACCS